MPIKHSACHWCYAESIPLEEFCRQGKALGLDAVDLLTPDQMEIADRYSLACPIIANPVTRLADGTAVGIIEAAFNRLEHHDALVEVYTDYLKAAKSAGAQNVICFSGNRNGMDDQTGMENCATGIRRLLPLLDELDVTLTMELLNSKVDHPDYMCDHTKWGVGLCELIGSARFKLLYDIYHMQIMEGDVIATIEKYHQWFSHYHTGGVPGRNEIDASQELNYPAIIAAIERTGYQGYVAQEFIPTSERPMESLKLALEACTLGRG